MKSIRSHIKRTLLPTGERPRTLKLGLGRGVRMEIDFAHQTRLYLGLYERELNRHIRAFCKPGVWSFDVGGQHGYDALVFAKLTGAPVATFEADPECCQRMRDSFGLNPGLAMLTTVVEGYAGNRPGEVSLDEFAQSEAGFDPGFIKIDVEGMEASVLRSAEGILTETRPSLIIEVHSIPAEQDCIRILERHGYRPEIIKQRRFLK